MEWKTTKLLEGREDEADDGFRLGQISGRRRQEEEEELINPTIR